MPNFFELDEAAEVMNESICIVCLSSESSEDNPMLLCDRWSRSFEEECNAGTHLKCAKLASVPAGNWYCKGCSEM